MGLRGRGISDSELSEKSGIPSEKIRELRNGEFDEQALLRVAPVLGLAPRALVDLAKGDWQPQEIQLDGLAQFSTHYGEMLVNAYLIWDPETKDAAAFDTGIEAGPAKDGCWRYQRCLDGHIRRKSKLTRSQAESGRGKTGYELVAH